MGIISAKEGAGIFLIFTGRIHKINPCSNCLYFPIADTMNKKGCDGKKEGRGGGPAATAGRGKEEGRGRGGKATKIKEQSSE